jgi:rhodanese-related sulfurtransferase
VLDPSRDPGPYPAAARRRGLRLAYTVETHLHADFVSGSRELAAGHIPGAAHVELGTLTDRPALPAGPVAVVCGHGERAMTAASLLQRQGRSDVSVVAGGTAAWAAAGRRLEPQA